MRNNKWNNFFAPILLLVLFGLGVMGGEKAMADSILYRASLANDKNRVIIVKQNGTSLTLSLEGFGDSNKQIELKANGGGTSTCRTIIEHNSAEATVVLSLAIPNPRARCRMLPSFVSIESRTYNISIDEETVKKIVGSNKKIRKSVEKVLGKIDEEEG